MADRGILGTTFDFVAWYVDDSGLDALEEVNTASLFALYQDYVVSETGNPRSAKLSSVMSSYLYMVEDRLHDEGIWFSTRHTASRGVRKALWRFWRPDPDLL
jgi:hypothetical protein